SGNRRQPTPGQGSWATGGNLPLGRGLGQQVAIYPWAGVSGNGRQPTTGQGPRATDGNLPLGRGLRQQAEIYPWAGASTAMAQALRGTTGSYTLGTPWGGSSKGSLGM
ncbi:unnamed protein product, partial [Staurois parvus]